VAAEAGVWIMLDFSLAGLGLRVLEVLSGSESDSDQSSSPIFYFSHYIPSASFS
jgi:hypothetical protein